MKRSTAFALSLSLLTIFGWLLIRSSGTQAKEAEADTKPAAEQTKQADEKAAVDIEKDVTQGALRFVGASGATVECPLKHTDVQANVSGFVARAKVTQTFQNPTKEKIEAVYVFPLPHEGAVDDMTMVIGDRKIVGLIKRRDEARSIYENALMQGQTAALLEQERPNIFTQSVGNIGPGEEIKIEISYVDVLNYDQGTYEFHFPMVVGPRYNPGQRISSPGATPPELEGKVGSLTADTDRVPDASRINPPVLKPGFRNGHDISLSLTLDAGVPVKKLKVANHKADVTHDGAKATIKLSAADSLPNKDFVLRYHVVGDKPEMAMLAHTGNYSDTKAKGSGYFMLMVQPKEDERLTKSPPREVVFLVDVSGSMSGEPTNKTIEAMQNMLKLCREKDTVQVITFASQANKLFEKPVPVNKENIAKALKFTEGLQGAGGTEMLKGVQMAIEQPIDNERLRIVIMLTDGYIGNEAEIIEHVGKHCGDQIRFWCIGMGQGPNSFLVDGVAKQGGGMGKNLGLQDDSTALAQEVMTRIQRAQLSKVKIDWGELKVSETYPAKLPELWAGRPVVVFGRFNGNGEDSKSTVTVSGMIEGEPASWPLTVNLPAEQPNHDVLAKVWARKKIEDLMQQDFYQNSAAIEEIVTGIALDYRLMSQYTSFVAVDANETEKATDRPAKPPRRMLVPVPLPEGTRYEGFFGPAYDADQVAALDDNQWSDKEEATESLAFRYRADSRSYFGRGTHRGHHFILDGSTALGDSRAQRWSFAEGGKSLPRLFAGATPAPAAQPAAMAAGLAGRGGQVAQLQRGVKVDAALGLNRPRPALESLSVSGAGEGYVSRVRRMKLSVPARRLGRGDALAERELADLDGDFGGEGEWRYAAAALQGQAEPLAKDAQEALKAAEDLQSKSAAQARTQYLKAYFHDLVAASAGLSSGEIAAQAMEALQKIRTEQIDAWKKESPAISKKLDLVIRDQSLEEALQQVAEASGMKIDVLDGSTADAAELLMQDDARISFLDLRGATLAEALDWILLPARLEWTLEKDRIVAGADRRRDGVSAWVYDVSLIALPAADETEKDADAEKHMKVAKDATDRFIKVVREHLNSAEPECVAWLNPGQIVVIGSKDAHSSVETLVRDLSNTKAKLTGKAAELQKLTVKRAEERKEGVAKRVAAQQLVETAAAHEYFGWQLLAAAADGQVDLEALTELQIAWHRDATGKLLAGKGRSAAMRSWWILSQAAKALPDEAELQELATYAADQCRQHAETALAELEKDSKDSSAFASLLFAALADRDDRAFVSEALAALAKAKRPEDGAADAKPIPIVVVAQALLGLADKAEREAMRNLVASPVLGEDMVVLTALACRRLGGDIWDAFRAAQSELIGKQPLDGNVVVLVSRLGEMDTRLATAAAAERQ